MTNALAASHSPYLRQHADNPVRWQSWSPEAFAEAKRRDVPVLVSIGYSTCHWCHVMAHESFEDGTVAAYMNLHFVCIKVDREEHPEVDAIYMDTVQALTGHGGWPLNAFTDAEGRPFYACTYLPTAQWTALLAHLFRLWHDDRAKVMKSASEITAHLAHDASQPSAWPPEVMSRLEQQLQRAFDTEHPGLGWNPQRAPKFPPSQVLALQIAAGRAEWLRQAEAILEAMQDAGLHDRVGGGFHRYSVTRDWRLPHFEKMLYDNAQSIASYARAGVRLNRADFVQTAINAGDYLLRDLRVVHDGIFQGYACAEDADDPGGEGSFYAWSPAQLVAALGDNDGARLAAEWNISPGEPEVGPHGHVDPVTSHIPHPRGAGVPNGASVPRGEEGQSCRQSWEAFLPRLRAIRATRLRPGRDDKVLTDQNALALEAFASLGRYTGEARFIAATRELAEVLMARHRPDGLVRLQYPSGATFPAFITDYGALVAGLMAAFDLLGDPRLINAAEQIADEAVARLRADDGGFFTTAVGRGDLVRRGREVMDNAWPAGQNSLALGLVRLWNVTGVPRWRELAEGIFTASAMSVAEAPAGTTTLIQAWLQAQAGHCAAVIQGGDPALAIAVRRATAPHLAIIDAALAVGQPWTSLAATTGGTGVQICLGTACLAPAKTTQEINERLAKIPAIGG